MRDRSIENKARRDLRLAMKSQGRCVDCGSPSPEFTLCETCRSRNRDYGRQYRIKFSGKANETRKLSRLKTKRKVFDHYGARCACCGEETIEFLSIDHIWGGGTKHRKSIKKDGSTFYVWIIKNNYPADLQVMCYNCNCGRRFTSDNLCPHQTRKKGSDNEHNQ